jgi:hypothetical protein
MRRSNNKVLVLKFFAGKGTETAPLFCVLEGISVSCSTYRSGCGARKRHVFGFF